MSKVIATKRVLIVGNGAAGSQLAAQLAKDKKYAVTVITPFEYSEVSLCMTKAIAMGAEEHSKIIFPLLREEKVDYAIDSIASLTNTSATLASGKSIEFDVCVLATGQRIPLFYPALTDTTKEIRIESVATVSRGIVNAKSIVISGGGAVGSELAADIKLRNKDKKVTLVQPNGTILSMMRHPLPELAQKHMEEINVEIVSNDRVISHDNGEVTLASGKRIPCDLYIPAFPTGGNATFLTGSAVDARGYAVVDDTFTVASYRNVFALGDCSSYDKVKTYPKIDDQLPVLKFNLEAVLNNTPLKHHIKGASLMGKLDGPGIVALGHSHEEGWGVGPDLPGCLGTCCWCCCFFGYPCSPPVGKGVAKMKSDFNGSIFPKKGIGIH